MAEEAEPKQDNQEEQNTEKQDSERTFTREEMASIVKKQVAQQLADKQEEWENERNEAVAKAKEDGKAEASMTAKQLAEKHAKDREAALDDKAKKLDQLAATLQRRDHIAHTKDLLAEQNLPTTNAEMFLGETEEETKANIKQYKDMVDQGVRNEIHRRSAQKAPQVGSSTSTDVKPDKPLSQMSYAEMQKYLEAKNQ